MAAGSDPLDDQSTPIAPPINAIGTLGLLVLIILSLALGVRILSKQQKVGLFLIIFFIVLVTSARAESDNHLFSTGRIMEIDRCASAWLIKRFADPEAEFLFFEDGRLITEGTAFDTPDARFTRTHNRATFEALMHHYHIDDHKLKTMAAAIHDLEINYWAGSHRNPLAVDMAASVNAIIQKTPEPEQCLEECFRYFDQVFDKLSTGTTK